MEESAGRLFAAATARSSRLSGSGLALVPTNAAHLNAIHFIIHFDALPCYIFNNNELEKWVRISISAHQCTASHGITFRCIASHFKALHHILMLYIAIFLITMHWNSGSGLELVPVQAVHLYALHFTKLHYSSMHCIT